MSEYQNWGQYYNYSGHITHEMLNKAYAESGMFFKTYAEAQVHQMQAGGKIHTIRNYHTSEFEYGKILRKDARLHIEGYYVSHPPKIDVNKKIEYFRKK